MEMIHEVKYDEGIQPEVHDRAAENDGAETTEGAPLVRCVRHGVFFAGGDRSLADGLQTGIESEKEHADDDLRDKENERARQAEKGDRCRDDRCAEGEAHIAAKRKDRKTDAAVVICRDAIDHERALRVEHRDTDAGDHREEAEQIEI